jgi:hypothetical protein
VPHRLELEGWIAMRWMPSLDSYDVIVGAAIVFFLTIIVMAALL